MSQLDIFGIELGPKEVGEVEWDDSASSVRWSYTWHTVFRRCQLQFFFGQIMANHRARDPERRDAYILKQLQDLPAWRGSLVDYGIEKFIVPSLKFGKLPPIEGVITQTLEVATRQWAFSKEHKYQGVGVSKTGLGDNFCALFPHEYGVEVTMSELAQVRAEIEAAFHNLYGMSDFLQMLLGHSWYKPKPRLPFRVDHAYVQAELDLLFFRGSNRPVIVDWKAVGSDKSDYTWQMLVYALAVKRRWPEMPPEDIAVFEVHLLDNYVKEHNITEERLIQAEDFICRSVLEIEALTGGKPYKEQNPEDYEAAYTPRTCAVCNWKRLCLARKA